MGRLEGKVAIITGAGAGLGRHAAVQFVAEGASVVVADIDRAAGDDAVREMKAGAGGNALFVRADVGHRDEVERLVDVTATEFGRIDILYANVGHHDWGDAVETTPELWERSMAVNLGGQFFLAKYGIPHLEQAGGGSIIFTGSDYGLMAGKRSVAYCTAKGALINMTRAMALDCGGRRIRVNCLVPGPFATGRMLEVFKEEPEYEEKQTAAVMLGRLGRPDEIAGAAVFLASDESSFMTGSVLVVDGGVTAWYGV